MSAQDPVLAERYGAQPRIGRRRTVIAAVIALAAVFTAWVLWVATVHGNPAVTSELQSFEVPSEHEATASVRVWLDDDAEGARCTARAMAYDHAVVGERTFAPTDGLNEVYIRTDRKAAAVTMVGCTAQGQADRAERPRPLLDLRFHGTLGTLVVSRSTGVTRSRAQRRDCWPPTDAGDGSSAPPTTG